MTESPGDPDSNRDRIYVYLAVFDFGSDPTTVTTLLGIQPTRVWIKGQTTGGDARAAHERWCLESPSAPDGSIEKQIADLLTTIESRHSGLQAVQERFRTAFRVAGYFHSSNSSWELSSEVVRRLGKLNLLVDFDIYTSNREPTI
jgi:hypothetical protein